MKKTLAIALSLIMAVTALTACSSKDNSSDSKSGEESNVGATGTIRTGLGVTTTIGKSKAAGESAGTAQVDTTVVAILLDPDGKISDVKIDAVQTIINFDNTGKITTALDTEVKTKQELGDEYGMKKNSDIEKEWNEQATFFANYVKGKTIAEVEGIALDNGVPSDNDIKVGVTMNVSGYIATIKKAAQNAKELGASVSDKVGLGIVTTISDSKDAGEADGLAQAYSYYAAVTVGADKKVTSAVFDASQSKVNFDTAGALKTDLTAEFKTKQELGDDYNMKSKSGIGKEWYEQANAFADYVKGKSTDEVAGITVAEGKPTDETLKAGVTVTVTDFIKSAEKAIANAIA